MLAAWDVRSVEMEYLICDNRPASRVHLEPDDVAQRVVPLLVDRGRSDPRQHRRHVRVVFPVIRHVRAPPEARVVAVASRMASIRSGQTSL